ncbi:MAG: PAS domain-containing protein [Thermoleophilaceae bacterium]|nr:PAS domain-containing protein [Thermoleophilaceae bacterium]
MQRPLELILARNLLSSLSTPAFLVDRDGLIAFFNEAAGALLGKRYEEVGSMSAAEWGETFGPLTADGERIPFEDLPLTNVLRRGKSAHARLHIRNATGDSHEIEASALPIVAAEIPRGAIVFFWPVGEE